MAEKDKKKLTKKEQEELRLADAEWFDPEFSGLEEPGNELFDLSYGQDALSDAAFDRNAAIEAENLRRSLQGLPPIKPTPAMTPARKSEYPIYEANKARMGSGRPTPAMTPTAKPTAKPTATPTATPVKIPDKPLIMRPPLRRDDLFPHDVPGPKEAPKTSRDTGWQPLDYIPPGTGMPGQRISGGSMADAEKKRKEEDARINRLDIRRNERMTELEKRRVDAALLAAGITPVDRDALIPDLGAIADKGAGSVPKTPIILAPGEKAPLSAKVKEEAKKPEAKGTGKAKGSAKKRKDPTTVIPPSPKIPKAEEETFTGGDTELPLPEEPNLLTPSPTSPGGTVTGEGETEIPYWWRQGVEFPQMLPETIEPEGTPEMATPSPVGPTSINELIRQFHREPAGDRKDELQDLIANWGVNISTGGGVPRATTAPTPTAPDVLGPDVGAFPSRENALGITNYGQELPKGEYDLPPEPRFPGAGTASPGLPIPATPQTKPATPTAPAASLTGEPADPMLNYNFGDTISGLVGGKSRTFTPEGGTKWDSRTIFPLEQETAEESWKQGNQFIKSQTPEILAGIKTAKEEYPDPDALASRQAEISGAQATNTQELLRAYKNETDNVRKAQLWDAIIRGVGQISAGIASGVSGYDVSGSYEKMKPQAYDPKPAMDAAQEKYKKGEISFSEYTKQLMDINNKRQEQLATKSQIGVSPNVLDAMKTAAPGSDLFSTVRGKQLGEKDVLTQEGTLRKLGIDASKEAAKGKLQPHEQPHYTYQPTIASLVPEIHDALSNAALSGGDTPAKYLAKIKYEAPNFLVHFPEDVITTMWNDLRTKYPKEAGSQITARLTKEIRDVINPPPGDNPNDPRIRQIRLFNNRFGLSFPETQRVQIPGGRYVPSKGN